MTLTSGAWPAADLTDLCTVLYGWGESAWDRLLLDSKTLRHGTPEVVLTYDLTTTLQRRFGPLTGVWRQETYDGSAEGGEDGTNADWEWWVADESGWNGVRVQAKKMDPRTGLYPDLNRDEEKREEQARRLITNAQELEGRPASLYCFYNAWDDAVRLSSPLRKSGVRRDFGATIVSAPQVLEAIEQRRAGVPRRRPTVGFDTVGEHVPLAQLFCSRSRTPREALTLQIARSFRGAEGDATPRTEPVDESQLPDRVRDVIVATSGDADFAPAAASRLAERRSDDTTPGTVIVTMQDERTLKRAVRRAVRRRDNE